MTNQISIALALIILGVLAYDFIFLDWQILIFWVRKLAEFSEWMAFWR